MGKQIIKRTKLSNTILIPTDFSETCENAVSHGIELANYLHYKVCILHIISDHPGLAKGSPDQQGDMIKQNFRRYKSLSEDIPTLKIDLLVREGKLLNVINKVAKEVKANVIILGTHGKQGLQHLFGSNALKVVLDAPCPVVVVQNRPFGEGYRKILLPLSTDVEPRHSVNWVLLMNRLFNSRIYLYQSLETENSQEEHMKNITRHITGILDEKKISYQVSKAKRPGDFTSQVISFAEETGSDMIMTTTLPGEEVHGFDFSAWNEQLMFNKAQVPVMCVNPIAQGEIF
jgi:nucleotide-binding universal stress UspA family protein